MSQLIIRSITAEDRTEWQRLWTGYLTFYESEISAEVYDSSFNRLIGKNPHDFNGFLAFLDEKPVGLAHYLFHRHGWKIENTCYLQDLYTDPSARGRGVGRALIQAVYDAADKEGSPSVYWMTQEFNAPARALYDQMATVTPYIKYARVLTD